MVHLLVRGILLGHLAPGKFHQPLNNCLLMASKLLRLSALLSACCTIRYIPQLRHQVHATLVRKNFSSARRGTVRYLPSMTK